MAKVSDYLGIGEAAAYLGVHPDTLRRWDRAGKLEPHRHPINNFRLYLQLDLDRFLAQIGGAGSADDHPQTKSVTACNTTLAACLRRLSNGGSRLLGVVDRDPERT